MGIVTPCTKCLTQKSTHLHAGPSLAFVGNTPQDLRENTARATPNIELGKDAAKAVDRNKPALPSPGQVQDKVKDASRKIKNEVSPARCGLGGTCRLAGKRAALFGVVATL